MTIDKFIIIGEIENNLFLDKEGFEEFLQHIHDINKWNREVMAEIEHIVKLYEASGNIPVPVK